MNKKKLIKYYYDPVIGRRKEYSEMTNFISERAQGNVCEVGSGTGLLTKELLKQQAITKILCVDIDEDYIKKFKETLPQIKVIHANAIHYSFETKYDMIVMSLVYHHIDDNEKEDFLKQMYDNLIDGGEIIIGDTFILPYGDEKKKKDNLILFHYKRIVESKSEIEENIERQALKDGLKREGEWKTSVYVLKKQLSTVGFKEIKIANIGSQETGGYKVVTAIKF